MPLKCKYCHKIVAEDAKAFIEEHLKKGENYIECPFCSGLSWIGRLEE